MDINAIGNSKINENYHKNSVDNSLKNNIHDQISIFNNDSNSNFYVSNVVEYVNDEDKNADINEIYCKIDIADQQVENKRMQIKSILDGTFSNEELNQEQRIYNRWYDALLLALDEEAENIPDDKIEEYEELQDALLQNIENTNIVNTLISDEKS